MFFKREPQEFVKPAFNNRFLTACLAVVIFFFLLFGAVMRASAAVAVAAVPPAVQGARHFEAGEYTKAIAAYKAAAQAQPQSSVLADALGQSYARAAETSVWPGRLLRHARASFERALRLDPQNTAALQHLIALSADPVSPCAAQPPQTALYIERLAALDAEAAAAARGQWRQRQQETATLENRLVCGPAQLGRVVLSGFQPRSKP